LSTTLEVELSHFHFLTVWVTFDLTFFLDIFFSGATTLFANTVLSHFPPLALDIHDGDIEVESKEDWFTVPEPTKLAGRTFSRVSEVMLIEVSSSLFFYS